METGALAGLRSLDVRLCPQLDDATLPDKEMLGRAREDFDLKRWPKTREEFEDPGG